DLRGAEVSGEYDPGERVDSRGDSGDGIPRGDVGRGFAGSGSAVGGGSIASPARRPLSVRYPVHAAISPYRYFWGIRLRKVLRSAGDAGRVDEVVHPHLGFRSTL